MDDRAPSPYKQVLDQVRIGCRTPRRCRGVESTVPAECSERDTGLDRRILGKYSMNPWTIRLDAFLGLAAFCSFGQSMECA